MEGTQASREILFRGKNRTLDKWVEGCYLKRGKDHLIYGKEMAGVGNYVDEKTVGQYVNRVDRNGQKIFEGDIVRFYLYDTDDARAILSDYLVYYEDAVCGFMIQSLEDRRAIPDDMPTVNDVENYEVIGNCWDNPEMLEVTR